MENEVEGYFKRQVTLQENHEIKMKLKKKNWQQKFWQLIRYQFRNHLTIKETSLETKNFLVSKMVSNLVTTNYFVSKNWFLFHDFLVVLYYENFETHGILWMF